MVRAMVAFGLRKSERVMPVSDTVVRITGTKTTAASDDVPTVRPWQKALRKQGTAPVIKWANATRDLERACARAGLEKVTPNDLRRTLATWLNRDGVPRWAISRILRHKSTRMVDAHYAKPTLADVAKACR
jgi:integrase